MNSIYETGSAELIARVRNLNADSPALWGKMNVAQAMAHTAHAFLVGFGDVPCKRGLLGKLLGWMFRKSVLGDKPFKKNSPTGPDFIVTGERDFDVESGKLIEALERIARDGHASIKTRVHPFFGAMTPEDWDTLLTKHTDHHLRQFGA